VIDKRDVFQELVSTRRSIRSFTDQPVGEDVLGRLLRVACDAPSAHNRQPWRFVVLQDVKLRQRLIEAMSQSFRTDLERDGLSSTEIERQVARGRDRILGASAVVLLFVTMEDMDHYPDGIRQAAERAMAIQSVALAGGHLLLAAHAEGLGACWVCSPLFAPEIVRQTLELPESWEAQGMIVLGHPAEDGRDRQRKSLQEVALWR
jgi:coenzyme F420-0:L-glutamate ligase/coenzyme F420-1:gamma-L-glutamate ligase